MGIPPCVFPHSEIRGSRLICSSPRLIAACRVLHRLLVPRHSPCALISLTFIFLSFTLLYLLLRLHPSRQKDRLCTHMLLLILSRFNATLSTNPRFWFLNYVSNLPDKIVFLPFISFPFYNGSYFSGFFVLCLFCCFCIVQFSRYTRHLTVSSASPSCF